MTDADRPVSLVCLLFPVKFVYAFIVSLGVSFKVLASYFALLLMASELNYYYLACLSFRLPPDRRDYISLLASC